MRWGRPGDSAAESTRHTILTGVTRNGALTCKMPCHSEMERKMPCHGEMEQKMPRHSEMKHLIGGGREALISGRGAALSATCTESRRGRETDAPYDPTVGPPGRDTTQHVRVATPLRVPSGSRV